MKLISEPMPLAHDASGAAVSTKPSITGQHCIELYRNSPDEPLPYTASNALPPGDAPSAVNAEPGLPRMHATTDAAVEPDGMPIEPHAVALAYIDASAYRAPSEKLAGLYEMYGDSAIMCWNSPADSGDAVSSTTWAPPALSPTIVTKLLSPPNVTMFCCTHCRLLMLSIMP